MPWASTVGEVLKRFGLVKPRKRRPRVSPYTAPFAECSEPNQVWCAAALWENKTEKSF